jgi:hypothetical protein
MLENTAIEVHVQQPSLVVVSPMPYIDHYTGATRWGHYQFPIIRRLEDGRLALSYSVHADSSVSYGKENPLCVSSDGGRTWKEPGAEEREAWLVAGGMAFSDGETIVFPIEQPLDAASLKLPPRRALHTDGWGRKSDCYRLGDLPAKLTRVKMLRRMPGKRDWVEEWAQLDVPDIVVHVFRWEGTDKGMVDPNILVQQRICTEFFWTVTPDGALLTFQYLRLFKADGAVPKRTAVVVLRSDDRGRSWYLWGMPGFFADDKAITEACQPYLENPGSNYNRLWGGKGASPVPNLNSGVLGEPGAVSFGDGRMLCTMRSDEGGTHQPVFISRSADWGKSWTMPEILTPFGVVPRLVHLDNGVIALVYGRPGVQLLFCTDGQGERWHTPINLLPEPGEKTRAPVGFSRGTVTTDENAGWDDTCGNCTVLKSGPDRFLVAYSDFRHPGADGKRYKAIKVQEVIVTQKR